MAKSHSAQLFWPGLFASVWKIPTRGGSVSNGRRILRWRAFFAVEIFHQCFAHDVGHINGPTAFIFLFDVSSEAFTENAVNPDAKHFIYRHWIVRVIGSVSQPSCSCHSIQVSREQYCPIKDGASRCVRFSFQKCSRFVVACQYTKC